MCIDMIRLNIFKCTGEYIQCTGEGEWEMPILFLKQLMWRIASAKWPTSCSEQNHEKVGGTWALASIFRKHYGTNMHHVEKIE